MRYAVRYIYQPDAKQFQIAVQRHQLHNKQQQRRQEYAKMSHADVAHIPTDKSVQLLITYFREYKSQQNTSQTHSLHIPKYFYDPITYYIYGLRKIVI